MPDRFKRKRRRTYIWVSVSGMEGQVLFLVIVKRLDIYTDIGIFRLKDFGLDPGLNIKSVQRNDNVENRFRSMQQLILGGYLLSDLIEIVCFSGT